MSYKKIFKYIFIFTLLFSILLSYSVSFGATNTANAPIAILMDSSTGKIIYEKNAYEKCFPASTTKIMTAILALEHCNLSDIATVSYDAIFSVPVRI